MNGLVMNRFAPCFGPEFVAVLIFEVTMITGVLARSGSFLILRQVLKPSSLGITTSSRISAGFKDLAVARQASPSVTVWATWPSCWTTLAMRAASEAVSSAMRGLLA